MINAPEYWDNHNNHHEHALSKAIATGETEEINRLLTSGISPNTPIQDKIGRRETPLILALRAGNISSCELLIRSGADLNMNGFLEKKTHLVRG